MRNYKWEITNEGWGKTFWNVGKRGRWEKRQEIWDKGKRIKRWEEKRK